MLASARSSTSCTRSSARSTLPHNEMAKARNPGTAPKISWRTESSMRILFALVVQTVEQFSKARRHALADDFIMHCTKLLAEFCPGAAVKPVRFYGLFFVV